MGLTKIYNMNIKLIMLIAAITYSIINTTSAIAAKGIITQLHPPMGGGIHKGVAMITGDDGTSYIAKTPQDNESEILTVGGVVFFSLSENGKHIKSVSHTNPDNNLVGRWLSNCYEYTGDFGISNGFAIEEYEFTQDGVYLVNISKYSDFDCMTPNDDIFTFDATYTLGDSVISTDGTPVQLITVTRSVFSTSTFIYELAFRITGNELNFDFFPGPVPNLNYTITFIKQ